MTGRKRFLSDETRAEILRLFQQGMRNKDLVIKFGVSSTAVSHITGGRRKPPEPPPEPVVQQPRPSRFHPRAQPRFGR